MRLKFKKRICWWLMALMRGEVGRGGVLDAPVRVVGRAKLVGENGGQRL